MFPVNMFCSNICVPCILLTIIHLHKHTNTCHIASGLSNSDGSSLSTPMNILLILPYEGVYLEIIVSYV